MYMKIQLTERVIMYENLYVIVDERNFTFHMFISCQELLENIDATHVCIV